MGYIKTIDLKIINDVIPTKKVATYPNNKPWVTKRLNQVIKGNRPNILAISRQV